MTSTRCKIRAAVPAEAPRLTEIAFASKRHWGYPEAWIELWKDGLIVEERFVEAYSCYVAETDAGLVGFCAVTPHEHGAEIEHLWLLPESMGLGLGRVLFQKAIELAREILQAERSGVSTLVIVSDPNARGFYERMGARWVGEMASRPEGRRLPVLHFEL